MVAEVGEEGSALDEAARWVRIRADYDDGMLLAELYVTAYRLRS